MISGPLLLQLGVSLEQIFSASHIHTWADSELFYREIIICTMCVRMCMRACVGHAVFSESTTVTHFW